MAVTVPIMELRLDGSGVFKKGWQKLCEEEERGGVIHSQISFCLGITYSVTRVTWRVK